LKAFTPTNSGLSDLVLPEALTAAEAAAVPGVLGRITAERVAAYQNAEPTEAEVAALPERPGFAAALRLPGLQIIAEIKRQSPSLGRIADLEPLTAATAYEAGGAAALSILTEPNHFGGALSHLEEVAAGVALPLLRKDFTVHPAQLLEAKRAGASAVLLIVAVLGARTKEYLALARRLGLDALIEVHDEWELETALASGAEIVGVNNRDLKTLAIDLETAPCLMARARDAGFAGLLVAESGYRNADELLSVCGLADAVLVGSSVAGSADLSAAVRRLYTDLAAWEVRDA
jgi:indole-3-glycerol phosphate synthase